MNCIGEILKQLTFCRRLDYEIAYCFESLFELVVNGFVVRVHELYGGIDNLWSNPLNWTNGLPNADDPATEDTAKFKNGVFCVLDYAAPPISNLNMQQGASHLRLVDGAVLTCNSWNAIAYDGGEEDNRHLLEVLGV